MAIIAVGSSIVVSQGVNDALRENAKITAGDWADYLSTALPGIEGLIEGEPLTSDGRDFVEHAQQVGKVFRYKLFDAQGRLRLDSENLDLSLGGGEDLNKHNARAAEVVRTGKPFLVSEHGDGVTRPEHYAEAYYPLEMDGELVGTLEVYVDQTERTKQLQSELGTTALSIGTISALAFFVPACAFFWRSQQQRQTQDALKHAANHDGLTGLLNRTSFRRIVDRQIDAQPKKPFWILFIDLDKFKDVNDSRGHAVGDELLRRIAERLLDVSGENTSCCRLGGDEFAVLVPGSSLNTQIGDLADAIIMALGKPVRIRNDEVRIGASVGIAGYPSHAGSSLELLKAADLALYEAKRRGRNCYCFFETDLHARRAQRIALERRLRRAIEQDDFAIAFQPLFRTRDGALTGFEALLRLNGDDGDSISPGEFIPVAEETGLIVPLGRAMLMDVCRIAATWQKDLTVAVNLSPVQFESGKITETIAEALETSGLAPERLELEVTESILMTDPDSVALQLDALRDMGVSLALDDFGTGYSSLSYLWRYPFNKLKIDRSFIESLSDEDNRSRQVLKTVVALGEVLSMDITAEGVETETQAEQINSMKVDFVQGFLYGRPTLADKLSRIFDDEKVRHAEEQRGETFATPVKDRA